MVLVYVGLPDTVTGKLCTEQVASHIIVMCAAVLEVDVLMTPVAVRHIIVPSSASLLLSSTTLSLLLLDRWACWRQRQCQQASDQVGKQHMLSASTAVVTNIIMFAAVV